MIYGDAIKAGDDLGTRPTFADIGETAAALLGVDVGPTAVARGEDLKMKPDYGMLVREALAARRKRVRPLFRFAVGAALLTKSGDVYRGCNVENASYTPTNCAERTAVFSAFCAGEREFEAIAIVGGGRDAARCPRAFLRRLPAGAYRVLPAGISDYHRCR